MLANPLEIRGRHRVNNRSPEAALEAELAHPGLGHSSLLERRRVIGNRSRRERATGAGGVSAFMVFHPRNRDDFKLAVSQAELDAVRKAIA